MTNSTAIIKVPSNEIVGVEPLDVVRNTLKIDASDDVLCKNPDLVNLTLHYVQALQKNNNLADDTKLHIIRSKRVDSSTWTDVYGMEQLNKISIFDNEIKQFRTEILDVPFTVESIYKLKEVSRNVVNSILRTIRLRDRGEDGTELLNTLARAQVTDESSGIEKLVPLYNLIIYSVPFVFSNAMEQGVVLEVLNFAPYELCIHSIQELNFLVSMETNPNVFIRLQARLEGNLPDVGRFTDYYRTLLPFINRGMFYYRHGHQYLGLGMLMLGRQLAPLVVDSSSSWLTIGMGTPTNNPPSSVNPDIALIVGTSRSSSEAHDTIVNQIITLYP